jgi:competence protein ComEC
MRYWIVIILIIVMIRVGYWKLKPNVSSHREVAIGNSIWDKSLYKARIYFQSKLFHWLPGDSGNLASGILLGGDDSLSYGAKLAFRRTGLSHVLAASGYNVVVITGFVMGLGNRIFGKKRGLMFGMVCTILYMYLAGMSIPVIRAGLMAVWGFTGLYLGRKSDGWWSLFMISVIMLLFRPEWFFEISWQLSVAATIAVLLVGKDNGVWDDLRISVSAWVITLPLILYYFGQMSLIAPIANLLVLWVVPTAMEISGLALIAGLVWDQAGQAVALISWPLLSYMLFLVKLISGWEYSSLEVGRVNIGFVAIYYLVIGLWVVRSNRTWE